MKPPRRAARGKGASSRGVALPAGRAHEGHSSLASAPGLARREDAQTPAGRCPRGSWPWRRRRAAPPGGGHAAGERRGQRRDHRGLRGRIPAPCAQRTRKDTFRRVCACVCLCVCACVRARAHAHTSRCLTSACRVVFFCTKATMFLFRAVY